MTKNMNKRGDVPITILVIGIFALCTLALISFYFASIKVVNSFAGVSLAEEVNSIGEQISFYKINNPDMINTLGIEKRTNNGIEYYSINKEYNVSDGLLFWKKDKVLIDIEYRIPVN